MPEQDPGDEPAAGPILEDLGRRAFEWFQDHRHPETGLVRDRAPNGKGRGMPSEMASIAAVGYLLSLLPEAVRAGEIARPRAEAQAEQVLRFARDRVGQRHGLFYHFIHRETGRRWEKSEVSLLDSAIFFNGCVVAGMAFGGEVAGLADALLDRAEWDRFVVRGMAGHDLLSLGWTPEAGLLSPADVRSSEMAMPYFLAVGSRSHPIDPECWYHTTVNYGTVGGRRILNPTHPLFTSNYGLGWHDLEGLRDRDGVDLWGNAREAALANRAFCRAMAERYRTYKVSEGGWWGISAGDSPRGYIAPGPEPEAVDGTVWPLASLAALPWIAGEIREDLARWQASEPWGRALGDYGLSPFNLDKGWVGEDVIGIDLGSFALGLANARNRTVWEAWKGHPVARAALERLGYPPA